MTAPTSEELELIEILRLNVEDVLVHDYQKEDIFLVGWLRARDLDLERAEEFLRNSMQWRKDNSIDALLNLEVDRFYFDHFKRDTECHDKEGRPVFTVPFGEWDIPNSATEERLEGFKDYTLQGCEQIMEEIRKADKNRKSPDQPRISQCILLIDMAGFSFMNLLNVAAVSNGLSLLSVYEANYPESLHTCYLINCSSTISMLLSLVRPVLATKTYEKIKCFGSNQDEWSAAVLEVIDEDLLPPRFGGTKELLDEVAEEAEEAEEAQEASESDDDFHEASEDLPLD